MNGISETTGRLALYLLMFFIFQYRYLLGLNYQDKVVYFDVGQGDANLIVLNSDITVLIDGGPLTDFVHKLQKRIKIDEKIDYVVLTHPHEDHILGLIEILRRYSGFTLVLPTSCVNSEIYKELLRTSRAARTVYTDYFSIKADGGNKFEIKYGDTGISKCFSTQKDVNNSSVIVEIEYREKEFLFMGDVEKEREVKFINRYSLGNGVNILKAGHHCSNSSTSEIFLKAVSPDLIICSYGKDNVYGHPGSETLRRFNSFNVKHLDTVKEGDIIINLN